MSYFPDLSKTTMIDEAPYVRAVGWLDEKHDFPKGKVEAHPFAADYAKRMEALFEE